MGDYFDSRFYIGSLLSQKKTSSVLDIECGTGVLLHTSNANLKVGLELSFDSLKEVKKINSEINFIQGDAIYLPFNVGSKTKGSANAIGFFSINNSASKFDFLSCLVVI